MYLTVASPSFFLQLGAVTVPPRVLYEAKGERMEFKLCPAPGHGSIKDVSGFLAIRCRRATAYDKQFMKEFHESEKAAAAEHNHHELGWRNVVKHATESEGGGGTMKALLTRVQRVVRDEEHPEGVKQVC